MRRLVIHAGFHKTGTSTVQRCLRVCRPQLKPYLRSIMKAGMLDTIRAARGFSTRRDSLSLGKFCFRFEAMLANVAAMPRRVLCLSAEELSGHLPGRGPLKDYSAAPLLAAEMARIASELYPKSERVFLYSTRAPEPWLRSAYWEHVKASSLTMDFDMFKQTYAGADDLDAIVGEVARAVDAEVHAARLEDHRDRPAKPLLDLCQVPAEVRDGLPEIPPVNAHLGDDVLQALLEANREIVDPQARKAVKLDILEAERQASHD